MTNANSTPSLSHGLGEDLEALRESVRSFCAKHVGPRAAEIDQTTPSRVTSGRASVSSVCSVSR